MKFNCPTCNQKLEFSFKRTHLIYISSIIFLFLYCLVLSYSLYIKEKSYIQCKKEYDKLAKEMLPDWKVVLIPETIPQHHFSFVHVVDNSDMYLAQHSFIDLKKYSNVFNECLFTMHSDDMEKDIEFIRKWFLGQYLEYFTKFKDPKKLAFKICDNWKVKVQGMKPVKTP